MIAPAIFPAYIHAEKASTIDMKAVGSKHEVWARTAQHTSGGLTRADLMLNKASKVVSKRQHANGLKQAATLANSHRNVRTTRKPRTTGGQQGSGFLGNLLGGILPF